MKNSYWKISPHFLIIGLLFVSLSACEKEECDIDPLLKVLFKSGGSASLNNENITFQGAYYAQESNGEYTIQIGNAIWYDNTIWATRKIVGITRLENLNNDTLPLINNLPGQFQRQTCTIHDFVEDGDVISRCYEILELEDFPSWIVINEHHESIGEIAGSIQAAFLVSSSCPIDPNSSEPDTIFLRDCHFRAIKLD